MPSPNLLLVTTVAHERFYVANLEEHGGNEQGNGLCHELICVQ
jgi:hypothetical protein